MTSSPASSLASLNGSKRSALLASLTDEEGAPRNRLLSASLLLKRIAGNGVWVILVETANRFARDLIVQETGWRFLQGLGVTLIAADSPDSFLDKTPMAVLIRQVLGACRGWEFSWEFLFLFRACGWQLGPAPDRAVKVV